jgi:hypothetical protein
MVTIFGDYPLQTNTSMWFSPPFVDGFSTSFNVFPRISSALHSLRLRCREVDNPSERGMCEVDESSKAKRRRGDLLMLG